ncbi:hypothetical protein [Corticicoccus populi]|uniref:Uncharacterized protein n=1 Tax=Corticicoccus populi TaxID=1812821 RepID=A0ABW5WVG4_9STAP
MNKRVFNNRAFELVRNVVVMSEVLVEDETHSFTLSEDPFNMKFIVGAGQLFAAMEVYATQGVQKAYNIAGVEHLERLLYPMDRDYTQEQHTEFFISQLKRTTSYIYLKNI